MMLHHMARNIPVNCDNVPRETLALTLDKFNFFDARLFAHHNESLRAAFYLNLSSAMKQNSVLEPLKGRQKTPTLKQLQKNLLWQFAPRSFFRHVKKWKGDPHHVAEILSLLCWQRRFGMRDLTAHQHRLDILLSDRPSMVCAEHYLRHTTAMRLVMQFYPKMKRPWKKEIGRRQKSFLKEQAVTYHPYAWILKDPQVSHTIPIYQVPEIYTWTSLEIWANQGRGARLYPNALLMESEVPYLRWLGCYFATQILLELQLHPFIYKNNSVLYDLGAFLTTLVFDIRDRPLLKSMAAIIQKTVSVETIQESLKGTEVMSHLSALFPKQ